jgi:hypothetical protein
MEYSWTGQSCPTIGLRYANNALANRKGFLFDYLRLYPYEYLAAEDIVSYYANCLPDTDMFIRSSIPGVSGNYTEYEFAPIDSTVISHSSLRGNDIDMTFSTDKATYNLSGVEYKLIGPKNPIDYGIQTPTPYIRNYNSNTQAEWDPEVDFPYAMSVSAVFIDEGTYEGGGGWGLDQYQATACGTLAALSNDEDLAGIPVFMKLTKNYFMVYSPEVSGSNYIGRLKIYAYNFTTKAITLQVTYTIPSATDTEWPIPLDLPWHNGLIDYKPVTSSTGYILVGCPHWTNTKTDEGCIRVIDWNDANPTYFDSSQGIVTEAIRNGQIGSCIGVGHDTGILFYGQGDNIHTVGPLPNTTTKHAVYAGPKSSGIGRNFSVGDNGLILGYNADTGRVTLISYNYSTNTWATHISGSGYVFYDLCVSNKPPTINSVRIPTLVMKDTTTGISTQALSYATGTSSYTTRSGGYWSSWLNPVLESTYHTYGIQGYPYKIFYNADSVYFNITGSNLQLSISDIDNTKGMNMIFVDDNNNLDEILYGYTHSSNYDWLYGTVTLGSGGPIPHTEIGNWYIYGDADVSSYADITSASCSYTDPDSSTDMTFGFRLDGTGDYYTPDGLGGFNNYSTLELLRAGAANCSLFAAGMPLLSISSVDTITFYFFLEKTLDLNNPTTTPSISSITLNVTTPGQDPEICIHFSVSDTIKEVYRTSSNTLELTTPVAGDAAGVEFLASGTLGRVLT